MPVDAIRPPIGVVGREEELGRLGELFAAAEAGERRLVFVTGEPRAGKTTLVGAFLAGLDPSVRVARGQCVESRGSGEAYMPVLEALGRLSRAEDGDRLVTLLRERGPTWLVQLPWLVAEEERATLDSRVIGVTRDRMLREVVEVLEAFTRDEPAVLVLEDLHWADYSTLDLLDVVARRFEPARLLVLGTFRPAEARAHGHPLGALARSLRLRNLCVEVALGSLSPGAAGAFLEDRLDGAAVGGRVAVLLHVEGVAAELAWHSLEGHEPGRAVRHLRAAAGRSLELSAPREAIGHLTAALQALPSVADEAERSDLELDLQRLLGQAMIQTEGWSSPEAESALVRAQELARMLAERAALASTLHGLATVYEIRGEYDRSEALLAETLGLPAIEELPGALVDSNELMACSLFHQGSFEQSLEHAETALTHYDGVYANRLTAAFGEHPEVSCQLWAALATWFLGRPDEAMERAERAVAASTIGARSRARALAQAQASVVAHLRGDVAAARAWSAAAVEAGSELGFTYWRAMAGVLHGWARAVEGDPDGGLAEIRESVDLSRALGARMDDAFYLAVLADAAARNGRVDAARAALDEAWALVGNRPFFFAAELLRLRGELLDGPESERCLREALDLAEGLDSPSLRLRAATSLARRTRNAADAARVASVVAGFREGGETADVRAATALLAELGVPSPARAAAGRHAQPGRRSAPRRAAT